MSAPRIDDQGTVELALSLGFSRTVLLPVRSIQDYIQSHPVPGVFCEPEKLMPAAKSVLVAAMSFPSFLMWPEDCGEVSAFYFASQNAYLALCALRQSLSDYGVSTDGRQILPSKGLGMLSGFGVLGKNTLLRNAQWGSRFSLHTLITDIEAPIPDATMDARPCGDCSRCVAACPTGALTEDGFHAKRCLRYYMMGNGTPVELRRTMRSRLLGCEICQRVCPRQPNSILMPAEQPEDFSIEKLLLCETKHIQAIGQRIGANEARPNRLRAQASIVAGNSGNTEFLPLLKKLALCENETVSEHAQWAISNLLQIDDSKKGKEANQC